jgi:hypothetical protein
MNKIFVLSALLLSASSTMASSVAYIYSNNNSDNGINAYTAASDGKVTLIKGSPFPVAGTIVGTNGKFFLTQGDGYLFSYAVKASGAIGSFVSDINTQLYTGAACGTQSVNAITAQYDHTGKFVYVNLADSYVCSAIQTYEVSSSGQLTFKGATITDTLSVALPAVTGNNKFGEAAGTSQFTAFSRESATGVLNLISAFETDPTPNPGCSCAVYQVSAAASPDPTDHLAVVLYTGYEPILQLASYTVDSQGDTVSTNTWADMPSLANDISGFYPLKLDPTGKYLAVATGTGVQFFHFNGAAPITPFTGIIGDSGYVFWTAWDNSGHLYAVNAASGRLHVYTVTSKGVTESKDSPTASGLFLSGGPIIVRAE